MTSQDRDHRRKNKVSYFGMFNSPFSCFLKKGSHIFILRRALCKIVQLALFPGWIFKILNNKYSMGPT